MPPSEAKIRVPVPKVLASRVLYEHDHTCCVCNERSKRVQIHHIDEDPSNNAIENLTVLCLSCHDQTQISGGFGRKLRPTEVQLNRLKWIERVNGRRLAADKAAADVMSGATNGATENQTAQEEQEHSHASEAALLSYIKHLPDSLRSLYLSEREAFDEGAQQEQTMATMRVADVLESQWLMLVDSYPADRFPPNPREYISRYRHERGEFHLALARRSDGWPGSMTTTFVGWAVLGDLEKMIEDTVSAIVRDESFDIESWTRRWRNVSKRSLAQTLRDRLLNIVAR